jgi:hypothetical protein
MNQSVNYIIWTVILTVALMIVAMFVNGLLTTAAAMESSDSEIIACDSEPSEHSPVTTSLVDVSAGVSKLSEHYNEFVNSFLSQSEADTDADTEETEYVDEYYYYEPYSASEYTYTGGATATTTHDLLNGQGRAYGDDGTSYTYYNHDIGYGALDIPGETFDSDGVSHDGDGYIVVAADGYEYGEIIDTPYGEARVYDRGSGAGNVDIYTNR